MDSSPERTRSSDSVLAFAHPETGEILDSQEAFLKALDALEEEMQPYYRTRARIRQEYAERFEAPLPQPRWRSPTQEKVARCPRCGGPINE